MFRPRRHHQKMLFLFSFSQINTSFTVFSKHSTPSTTTRCTTGSSFSMQGPEVFTRVTSVRVRDDEHMDIPTRPIAD